MALSRFDGKVVKKSLASPATILPVATGVVLLLWGSITGGLGGLPGMLGVGAVGIGLATAAYRLFFSADRLAEAVQEEEQKEQNRRERTRLTRLRRRLHSDRDPRTGQCVEKLQQLQKRMSEATRAARTDESPVLPELVAKAEELYGSCIASLERSLELWEAAKDMTTTEARDELLGSREALVGEVVQSVDHLAATADHLQSASLQGGEEDESVRNLREELDMGLEVARRVSERVTRLEESLREREK